MSDFLRVFLADDSLAMTELVLLLPRHIDSLVICCPPMMRLLPWHLLLIEVSYHCSCAEVPTCSDAFAAHYMCEICVSLLCNVIT